MHTHVHMRIDIICSGSSTTPQSHDHNQRTSFGEGRQCALRVQYNHKVCQLHTQLKPATNASQCDSRRGRPLCIVRLRMSLAMMNHSQAQVLINAISHHQASCDAKWHHSNKPSPRSRATTRPDPPRRVTRNPALNTEMIAACDTTSINTSDPTFTARAALME